MSADRRSCWGTSLKAQCSVVSDRIGKKFDRIILQVFQRIYSRSNRFWREKTTQNVKIASFPAGRLNAVTAWCASRPGAPRGKVAPTTTTTTTTKTTTKNNNKMSADRRSVVRDVKRCHFGKTWARFHDRQGTDFVAVHTGVASCMRHCGTCPHGLPAVYFFGH